MNELERGRLAYIVDQAMMRRGLRPKYSKHQGYVAFHQLLKDYQAQIRRLEGETMYEGYDEDRIGIAPEWAYAKIAELEAQVKKYKKYRGWYGFEKMEVQRHVLLYRQYQKKFKRYYEKTEARIEELIKDREAFRIRWKNALEELLELRDKIARYERDVGDEDVFRGGFIP